MIHQGTNGVPLHRHKVPAAQLQFGIAVNAMQKTHAMDFNFSSKARM